MRTFNKKVLKAKEKRTYNKAVEKVKMIPEKDEAVKDKIQEVEKPKKSSKKN